MPNVILLSFTPCARELLIFTKQTRLEMGIDAMQRVHEMSDEDKTAELAYMAGTIRSSWEFADLTFLVSGITRATLDQMRTTRTASYAAQSLRVADASGSKVANPFDPENDTLKFVTFEAAAEEAVRGYIRLCHQGAKREDARGLLPLNIQTALVVKYNLRNFVDLVAARSSLRVQGEYADVVREMKRQTLDIWPWAAPFFESPHAAAIAKLEDVAKELGIVPGAGPGWEIAKAVDLLRKGN